MTVETVKRGASQRIVASERSHVILEVAPLDVIPGQEDAFEAAFATASGIIASMDGYISHELHRCIERPSRYLLLARWETLEDHTIGFRGSPRYREWKALLHHFYDPFPTVEHYQAVVLSQVHEPSPAAGDNLR